MTINQSVRRPSPSPVRDPTTTAANRVLMEQAKGALMLHYGIDSHQAFAVLIGWARISHTPVPAIAHALVRGICEGNPQTEARQPSLVRWLEAQLRDTDPHQSQLRPGAGPLRTGP